MNVAMRASGETWGVMSFIRTSDDRAFDEPFMQFDAHGREINGPLGTDRPHTIKAQGFYNLKWWKFDTLFGVYQQAYDRFQQGGE